MAVIANILIFNVIWLVTVLAAARGVPYVGFIVLGVGIAIQFRLHILSVADLKFILFVGVSGTIVDSVVTAIGLFQFPVDFETPWGLPLWMTALWLGFASTMRCSLLWLQNRLMLAALFGAISGSLSYVAGEILGAIKIKSFFAMFPFEIALMWFFITPSLFYLSRIVFVTDLQKDLYQGNDEDYYFI